MKAQKSFIQATQTVLEFIFPRKKHSQVIEHSSEKEIYKHLGVIRNKEHTALLPYNNKTVKHLIHAIKYENHAKSIRIATDILSEYIYEEAQEQETLQSMRYLLCTIPTTQERQNRNEHHHMNTLLTAIHKKIRNSSIKYEKNILQWKQKTQQQSKLKNKHERIRNMHHAMKVKKSLRPHTVCFAVDDVTTTGATLSEAKRALTEAGADTVITLALAH